MIENCIKCGTSFKVDEEKLTGSIKLFKCSLCNYEWSINDNFILNKKESKEADHENVKKELEAIRTEIKKNTDKISVKTINNQNNKETHNLQKNKENKVYNVKNKSVTEIASEIAESNVKKELSIKTNGNKKKIDLIKTNPILEETITTSPSLKVPVFMLLIILLLSSGIYFRSTVVGFSYAYFPNHTDNYFPKIYNFFKKVKIPFHAELNKMEISDFGATYEKNAIKFFGNIKNNSFFPIITPSIKAIVVTEDGKILAETIIPIEKKYILSKNYLSFSYLFKTNKSFDNTTVRATLLKEIQLNS